MERFAEVLLPLAVQGTYTYHIPATMGELSVGSRVLVPFGARKFYTAIVLLTHSVEPKGYKVKDILQVLDPYTIVRHPQLKFWQWLSDYYLCTMGEVYKAAVPAGLKVESETFISPNIDYEEPAVGALSERERVVLDFTSQRGRVQINEISRATGFKNVEGIVTRLINANAIHVSERAVDNYRPKTETMVRLRAERADDEALHNFFNIVKQAKKQERLLLAFLDLSKWLQHNKEVADVSKDALLKRADCSQAVLHAAVSKGIFEIYKKEINRFATVTNAEIALPELSDAQRTAYKQIHASFKDHAITLLHGVTSSGKTSIYMHLIADALREKKQVLYLVPEIALTTQLTRRLHAVFGDRLLIYHSKFSDNERVDIWKQLLHSAEPKVIIGVRSSIFLPFASLGLIIVDEEHDTSYKQQDPAPRYNGRNAALVLAQMHGAKTVLGSATPAVETYYNATTGRYGLVTLNKRYRDIKLPQVQVVDTKLSRRKHEMEGMFSLDLLKECRHALHDGEQVILFQNRRGYAPMVRCKDCGWVPTCINCDVSLTYHKHVETLTCHYCGHTITKPTLCPACGNQSIEVIGFGTERVEDEIDKVLPGEKISRMDLDTTRSKNSYERIIGEFSERKTNILVGTQMVTKGLDFDGVSIVGILNADTMISFPDFRSHERAFNMMEQVAGRAGRAGKQGTVVIQTSNPNHPVVTHVVNHDYVGFYTEELEERRRYSYPPFSRIINIYLKHSRDDVLVEMSVRYSNLLRSVLGSRVLGPEAPIVPRVQNLYIRQIVLKVENSASMRKVKELLRELQVQMLNSDSRFRSIKLYYDVDPV